MHSIFNKPKVHSEYAIAPQSDPDQFDDLVETISTVVQRQLINLQNYSSGWFGLYPKKTQVTFHPQVKQTLTDHLEQKLQILRGKIDEQKNFIEQLHQTNHHELKTAVHGIVYSSKNSLESLRDIQILSERLLELLETNLEIYNKVMELIETDLDIVQLSEELANLGVPKSLYQDRYFYLTGKKPAPSILEESANLRDRLKGILENHIQDINPELRQEIQRLSQELDRNNRLINQLMQQNTSEMRETLRIIASAAIILQGSETLSNPRQKKALIEASEHLLQLFHEGSNFQKAIDGNISLKKAEFSLSDLLNRIKDEYRLKQHRTIDLHFDIQGTIPPMLIGDEEQIETVIQNILFAILNSGKEGRVDVTIRPNHIAQEKIRLDFTITDTSSFPERKIHQTFSTDDGLEKSIDRRRFTASKLLEHMEGAMMPFDIETEENTTSSFHMTLEKQTQGTISSPKVLSVEESMEKLQGRKILIVDDSPVNRKMLKLLLEKKGIRTESAEDGLQAFEKIQADPSIDLVLMDLQMPVMDGFESTRKIRAWEKANRSKTLPILALSANDPEKSRQATLDVGMDDFAQKPYNEKLFVLMYSLILQRENESDLAEHGYEELLAVEGLSTHRRPSPNSPVEDGFSPAEAIRQRQIFEQSVSSKLLEAKTQEFTENKKG